MLLFGLAGYAGIALIAYFFADSLIFPAPPASYRDTADVLKLEVAPDVSISALFRPAPDAEVTILYSHGNGEDLGRIEVLLDAFRARGFSAFGYDYEGYGTSQGRPSERAVYRDVEAAFDYLVEVRRIPPRRIIAYGFSVGGGPAAHLASRHELGGLILDSTFVSALRVITRARLFPFDEFDIASRLPSVGCPVLVMHSKDDPVISFWHGERLFEAAPLPKHSQWFERAGHGGAPWAEAERYWPALEKFAALVAERARGAAIESS